MLSFQDKKTNKQTLCVCVYVCTNRAEQSKATHTSAKWWKTKRTDDADEQNKKNIYISNNIAENR